MVSTTSVTCIEDPLEKLRHPSIPLSLRLLSLLSNGHPVVCCIRLSRATMYLYCISVPRATMYLVAAIS